MKTQLELQAEQHRIANTKSPLEYYAWRQALNKDDAMMLDHGMTADEFYRRYGTLGIFSEAYEADYFAGKAHVVKA